MLGTRLGSLIARYPRRYIGRHRARMTMAFTTRGMIRVLAAYRGAGSAGEEIAG